MPEAYRWFLTDDWSPPYRAHRLHELLSRGELQSAEKSALVQNDNVSLAARELLPLLLENLSPRSGSEKEIADALAAWDGTMSRDRAEPLIFSMWLAEVNKALYADELGPLFRRYYGQRPRAVAHMLTRRQAWCDNVETPKTESCSDAVSGAFPSRDIKPETRLW